MSNDSISSQPDLCDEDMVIIFGSQETIDQNATLKEEKKKLFDECTALKSKIEELEDLQMSNKRGFDTLNDMYVEKEAECETLKNDIHDLKMRLARKIEHSEEQAVTITNLTSGLEENNAMLAKLRTELDNKRNLYDKYATTSDALMIKIREENKIYKEQSEVLIDDLQNNLKSSRRENAELKKSLETIKQTHEEIINAKHKQQLEMATEMKNTYFVEIEKLQKQYDALNSSLLDVVARNEEVVHYISHPVKGINKQGNFQVMFKNMLKGHIDISHNNKSIMIHDFNTKHVVLEFDKPGEYKLDLYLNLPFAGEREQAIYIRVYNFKI